MTEGRTLYRLSFTVGGKSYELLADNLDLTHPYFVSLTGLAFEDQSSLVVSPHGDEARKRFGEAKRLMLPVQAVQVIEEISARHKIVRFDVARPPSDPEPRE